MKIKNKRTLGIKALLFIFFFIFFPRVSHAVDYTCTLSGSLGYFAADFDHWQPPNLPTKKIMILKGEPFSLATTLSAPVQGSCDDHDVYIGYGDSWKKAKCEGYQDKIWSARRQARFRRLHNYKIGMIVINKNTQEKVFENTNCGTVHVYQKDTRAPQTEEGLIGVANKVRYAETFSKWIKPAYDYLEIGALEAAVRLRRQAPCSSGEMYRFINSQLYWCGYASFMDQRFYHQRGMIYPKVAFIDGLKKVRFNVTPPNFPTCTQDNCWVITRISKAKDIVLYTRPANVKMITPPVWQAN